MKSQACTQTTSQSQLRSFSETMRTIVTQDWPILPKIIGKIPMSIAIIIIIRITYLSRHRHLYPRLNPWIRPAMPCSIWAIQLRIWCRRYLHSRRGKDGRRRLWGARPKRSRRYCHPLGRASWTPKIVGNCRKRKIMSCQKKSDLWSLQSNSLRTHKTEEAFHRWDNRAAKITHQTKSRPPSTAKSPGPAPKSPPMHAKVANLTEQELKIAQKINRRLIQFWNRLSSTIGKAVRIITRAPNYSSRAMVKDWTLLWLEPVISTRQRWTKTWMQSPKIFKTYWKNRIKWLKRRKIGWASSSPR